MINLSFLEKVPEEYFCTYSDKPGQEFACKPKDFCDDPNVASYRPNLSLEDSYDNWVSKLGLECAGPSKIGLIASSYFIGWILTLTFLPRISDLIGRQKIIIGGNLIQLAALTVILFTTNYRIMIAAIMVLGMMATVRQQVTVVYLYENFRHHHYARVMGIDSCCQGAFGICGALYFMFISKSWFGLVFFSFCLSLFGTIGCMLFYYESPKYLLVTNQLEQTHRVLSSIAWWNGADQALVTPSRINKHFNVG